MERELPVEWILMSGNSRGLALTEQVYTHGLMVLTTKGSGKQAKEKAKA